MPLADIDCVLFISYATTRLLGYLQFFSLSCHKQLAPRETYSYISLCTYIYIILLYYRKDYLNIQRGF